VLESIIIIIIYNWAELAGYEVARLGKRDDDKGQEGDDAKRARMMMMREWRE
jgi:hypothetical protein